MSIFLRSSFNSLWDISEVLKTPKAIPDIRSFTVGIELDRMKIRRTENFNTNTYEIFYFWISLCSIVSVLWALRLHSVYRLDDELRQASYCPRPRKKIDKISSLACIREKKIKKDARKLVFFIMKIDKFHRIHSLLK